jgi:hypothetical protein
MADGFAVWTVTLRGDWTPLYEERDLMGEVVALGLVALARRDGSLRAIAGLVGHPEVELTDAAAPWLLGTPEPGEVPVVTRQEEQGEALLVGHGRRLGPTRWAS